MTGKFLTSSLLGLSLLSGAAVAEQSYDDRWYIAPGFNYTYTAGSGTDRFDRPAAPGLGGNLAFGRAFSEHWNLDLRISGAKLEGTTGSDDTEHYSLNLDALYFFNRNRIAPYAEIGVGVMRTNTGFNSTTNPVADIGLGVQGQFSDYGAAIRADVRWRVDFYDNDRNPNDDTTEYGELVPNLSLVLPLGVDKERMRANRISLADDNVDTRWHLGLSAGWLFPDPERDDDFGGILADVDGSQSYSVSVGRAVSKKWNTELRLFKSELSVDGRSGVSTGGEWDFIGAVFGAKYFFDRKGWVHPFLDFGIGAQRSELNDVARTNPILEAGLGFYAPLNDHGIALQFGGRGRFEARSISNNSNNVSEYIDWEVYAGLVLPLGERASAVQQKPIKPIPVSTPVTPPPADDDADGVVNALDGCPNSSIGAIVDAGGCEYDSDKDGVGDANDRCPLSAVDAVVDETGCSVDEDRDGVMNAADKCPNSAPGQAVDPDGCPLPEVIIVYFDTDSARLTSAAKAKLDRVSRQLLQRDYVVAVLGGHADSRASDAYNKALAKRRANSVKAYLVARGVRGANLTAKSFGERQPVGDNTTKAGRALNRRVEVKILNP